MHRPAIAASWAFVGGAVHEPPAIFIPGAICMLTSGKVTGPAGDAVGTLICSVTAARKIERQLRAAVGADGFEALARLLLALAEETDTD